MFDTKSRYAKLEIAPLEITASDGSKRTVSFVRRRFIPDTSGQATLLEHTVRAEDRLDIVTARYLGDPTLFWQICDANGGVAPDQLVETPGRSFRIALKLR
jgi:hypothetical protein